MKNFAAAVGLSVVVLTGTGLSAAAQEQVWLQIEAQPSLAEATAAARGYAARLPNVQGFDLDGRWYGIALGPFSPQEAERELANLRAAGVIPADSFIADGSRFGRQVWPVGAALAAPQTPVIAPPETAPEGAALTAPAPMIDETPAEARRSEAALDRPAREALQRALQYEGFYTAAIDGAFGPGTRRSMSDWQAAQGHEVTGVLTTRQRAALLGGYRDAIDSLALTPVRDAAAGIAATLPLGLVASEPVYVPPFARYDSRDGSGVQVLLISQTGDSATLGGLYAILQTLEIVPMEGPRNLGARSFTLTGLNDEIVSHTEARLDGETVKGFTLIWPAGDEKRRGLALEALRASFSTDPATALPDAYGAGAEQDIDLLAGLEIRRPDRARSGVFVDGEGAVLTTAEAVEGCARVTLSDDQVMRVAATEGGLALLRPTERLAPLAVGALATTLPRLRSEVAVSGYAYEGRLGAATLNYGALEDMRGLDGAENLLRLALTTLPGETGGPVFDQGGGIIGLLAGAGDTARTLPEDVSFAYDAETVATFLSRNGVTPRATDGGTSFAPEDLIRAAREVTVLVNCWN